MQGFNNGVFLGTGLRGGVGDGDDDVNIAMPMLALTCIHAQDMMRELEQSARERATGGGSGDVTDVLVRQLFLRWMQTQPQVVVSGNASGRDR